MNLWFAGTAGLARGLSDYINALTNNTVSDVLSTQFPVNVSFLSKYPDFLAFSFLLLLTGNISATYQVANDNVLV